MRSWASLLISTATALSLSACMDVCACPPAPATARVYGKVTSFAGVPIPAAGVRAYSAPAAGCHFELSGDYGTVHTRDDGSYVLGLAGPGEVDSACVFVFAMPPAESTGMSGSDTTLAVLDFRYDTPQDSVRVDPILKTR